MDATTAKPVEPFVFATTPNLSFANVFHADAVLRFGEHETKSSVITQLVRRLADTGRMASKFTSEVIDKINNREHLASTAFGRGLAFPHLRTHHVQAFAGAIGILSRGLSFDSNDGDETKLAFLVLSPYNDREHHIELMSRLVSLLGNKADTVRLIQNDNPLSFHRTLCSLDTR